MILKLLDFGLVILIWMTQLVVYPSFTYFAPSDLVSWHTRYTTAVSLIVMPLMFGQLAMHGLGLLSDFSWIRLLALALIVCAWVNTFFYAVPLHNRIAAGEEVLLHANSLVTVNWYRTIFWTLVAVLGFIRPLRTGSLFY